MRGLWQNPGQDGMRLETDGWNCRVSFAGVSPEFSGWVPMDYRHSDCLVGHKVRLLRQARIRRGKRKCR